VCRCGLEIGPRDVAAGQVMTARRTGGKAPAKLDGLGAVVRKTLDEIQATLFQAAKDRREAHSIRGVTKQQFLEFMKGVGGFAYGGFCGSPECEAEVKQQTGATVRVLPDPEFRSAEAAQDVSVVREAQRRGGGVGAGVLGFDPGLLRSMRSGSARPPTSTAPT